MDSTGFKDSNGISFAIFGHRYQKIWILQDWIEFWFTFLFENDFDSEQGHVASSYWRIPVGQDRGFWPLDLHKICGQDLTGSRLGCRLGSRLRLCLGSARSNRGRWYTIQGQGVEGRAHRAARSPEMEFWRRHAPAKVDGGAPVVLGDDGPDDDTKERMAKTMVWTACSRGSCRCD
jgi:hypothetical protein